MEDSKLFRGNEDLVSSFFDEDADISTLDMASGTEKYLPFCMRSISDEEYVQLLDMQNYASKMDKDKLSTHFYDALSDSDKLTYFGDMLRESDKFTYFCDGLSDRDYRSPPKSGFIEPIYSHFQSNEQELLYSESMMTTEFQSNNEESQKLNATETPESELNLNSSILAEGCRDQVYDVQMSSYFQDSDRDKAVSSGKKSTSVIGNNLDQSQDDIYIGISIGDCDEKMMPNVFISALSDDDAPMATVGNYQDLILPSEANDEVKVPGSTLGTDELIAQEIKKEIPDVPASLKPQNGRTIIDGTKNEIVKSSDENINHDLLSTGEDKFSNHSESMAVNVNVSDTKIESNEGSKKIKKDQMKNQMKEDQMKNQMKNSLVTFFPNKNNKRKLGSNLVSSRNVNSRYPNWNLRLIEKSYSPTTSKTREFINRDIKKEMPGISSCMTPKNNSITVGEIENKNYGTVGKSDENVNQDLQSTIKDKVSFRSKSQIIKGEILDAGKDSNVGSSSKTSYPNKSGQLNFNRFRGTGNNSNSRLSNCDVPEERNIPTRFNQRFFPYTDESRKQKLPNNGSWNRDQKQIDPRIKINRDHSQNRGNSNKKFCGNPFEVRDKKFHGLCMMIIESLSRFPKRTLSGPEIVHFITANFNVDLFTFSDDLKLMLNINWIHRFFKYPSNGPMTPYERSSLPLLSMPQHHESQAPLTSNAYPRNYIPGSQRMGYEGGPVNLELFHLVERARNQIIPKLQVCYQNFQPPNLPPSDWPMPLQTSSVSGPGYIPGHCDRLYRSNQVEPRGNALQANVGCQVADRNVNNSSSGNSFSSEIDINTTQNFTDNKDLKIPTDNTMHSQQEAVKDSKPASCNSVCTCNHSSDHISPCFCFNSDVCRDNQRQNSENMQKLVASCPAEYVGNKNENNSVKNLANFKFTPPNVENCSESTMVVYETISKLFEEAVNSYPKQGTSTEVILEHMYNNFFMNKNNKCAEANDPKLSPCVEQNQDKRTITSSAVNNNFGCDESVVATPTEPMTVSEEYDKRNLLNGEMSQTGIGQGVVQMSSTGCEVNEDVGKELKLTGLTVSKVSPLGEKDGSCI